MEKQKENTHGGPRPRAGRPAKPDKKITYSTKLRPDQIEWIRANKNSAGTLEKLIDYAMEK